MKQLRIASGLAVLLGLALLATPADAIIRDRYITKSLIAYAINDTITPMSHIGYDTTGVSDSTGRGANGTGGYVTDADTLLAALGASIGFTAESTSVYNMGDAKGIICVLRCIPVAGDTTTGYRFAVQFRGHLPYLHALSYADTSGVAASDSASVFAMPFYTKPADNAVTDSMVTLTGPTFPYGTAVKWWNEQTVSFSVPHQGRAVRVNQWFGWPDAISIPMMGPDNRYLWAPYFSIRLRCVGGPVSSGNGTTVKMLKPRIILHIIKVPS